MKLIRCCITGKQVKHTVAAIKQSAPRIYSLLTAAVAKRWVKEASVVKGKTGRKVNAQFLDEVLDEVAICIDRNI